VINLGQTSAPPPRRAGWTRIASIDVEWTKNYRIKHGNRPFCYSIVWLDLPAGDRPADLGSANYGWRSVYVDDPGETVSLVSAAADTLAEAAAGADLVTGHQLCSDLAVLAANADQAQQPIDQARTVWKRRKAAGPDDVRFLDTRFDAGHLLTGTSRRLVDVCTELGLNVTQPELRGTSMTALHRAWVEFGDESARERISVLNLRHSLSTAYVAAASAGLGRWDKQTGLNLNRAIADGAKGAWDWLTTPTFIDLLGDPCPSGTAPLSPSKAPRQRARPRSSTR
jgi:hypothetical protein